MKTKLLHTLITTIFFSFNLLYCKAESFTVNFWHNGTIIHSTIVEENNLITSFPNTNNIVSCDDDFPFFIGWTTNTTGYTNISSNIEPTYFDSSTPITSNTDLYAIFGNGTKEDSWHIVTQTSELTDGCQVIIANKKNSVAAGPQHTDKYRQPKSITLSSDSTKITDIGKATIFTIGVALDNYGYEYSFYSAAEKHYMVLTDNANATHTNATISTKYPKKCYWHIAISNNTTSIRNQFFTTRFLQYYSSSPRFACYESNKPNISLFKNHKATLWTICTKYKITLNYNDGSTREILSQTLNIPEEYNPPHLDNSIQFVGWATSIINPTNTQPTLYNHSTNSTLNNDINLYPVFATRQTIYSTIPQKYIDTEDFTLSESLIADIIVEPNLCLHTTSNCTINNLTIKTNLDDYGSINTTNGSLSTQQITIEKCFNSSRWFFFSLPFDCDLTDVSASDANGNVLTYAPDATSGDYVINHYDQNRSTETGKAWKELLGTNHTLNANQGYIIGYFGDRQITVKFTSQTPQTITVPGTHTLNYTNSWINTENTILSTNGWNLIGYPYFTPTNSSLSPQFVTIPNSDGITYTQTEYISAQISPFTSFFVQTTTAPIFNINNQQSSPALLESNNNKITISLSDTNSRSDHTTIINNPNTTTEYEIGQDLTKWIGYAKIPQIYSIQNDELLAFNSQSINNSTTVPLGIYIPNPNEYTFSINKHSLSSFNVNLYDNLTQTTTNLNNNDYTLHLDSGTYNNRFELLFSQEITNNSYIEKQNISIHQNNATLQIENLPNDAIIYIYDAIGHLIFQSPNNITSLNYNFTYNGIYIITIQTTNSIFTFKTSH